MRGTSDDDDCERVGSSAGEPSTRGMVASLVDLSSSRSSGSIVPPDTVRKGLTGEPDSDPVRLIEDEAAVSRAYEPSAQQGRARTHQQFLLEGLELALQPLDLLLEAASEDLEICAVSRGQTGADRQKVPPLLQGVSWTVEQQGTN